MIVDPSAFDTADFVDYLSKLNVVAWTVGPRGNLFVILERKPPKLVGLPWKKAHEHVLAAWTNNEIIMHGPPTSANSLRDPLLSGKPVFVSAALASGQGLIRKIARVGKLDAGDKDLAGHLRRIRDEVRMARNLSAAPRRDSQEAAARGEIKTLIQRCKQRFGLNRARLVEILQEEVDLAMVEDVMKS